MASYYAAHDEEMRLTSYFNRGLSLKLNSPRFEKCTK